MIQLRPRRLQPDSTSDRADLRHAAGDRNGDGAQIDILSIQILNESFARRANLNAGRDTPSDTGRLVEDSWPDRNYLTIRPGVRYEQESLSARWCRISR